MVVPFFILPFVSRFPVGLLIYWMTTNLWTVGQGIITRRMVPKPAPAPKRSSRTPPKEQPAVENGDGAGPAEAPATAAAVQSTKPSQPRRVKRKKKRGGRR
jgi:YidC/Oxa1 family membrane protein insertase